MRVKFRLEIVVVIFMRCVPNSVMVLFAHSEAMKRLPWLAKSILILVLVVLVLENQCASCTSNMKSIAATMCTAPCE